MVCIMVCMVAVVIDWCLLLGLGKSMKLPVGIAMSEELADLHSNIQSCRRGFSFLCTLQEQ